MAYEYTRRNDLFEDVAYLCKKKTYIDENGVTIENGFEEREVFCRVGGVYQKEFFEAYQSGVKLQWYMIISSFDYGNEDIIKYQDSYYSLYRKYPQQDDTWELYLREDAGTWNNE